MLTDAGALGLSLWVIRYVGRPGGEQLTYGRRRAEVLSGQANGAVLLVLAAPRLRIDRRLISPPKVAGIAVTIVAGVGIAVNVAAAPDLAGESGEPQCRRQLPAHPHGPVRVRRYAGRGTRDRVHGIRPRGCIASLFVAALMCGRVGLQRKAIRVLLEGAPEGLPPSEVGTAMVQTEQVIEVHDLHLWELAPGHPILTAHVLVEAGADCHAVRRGLERVLRERFQIDHTTLQVDHAPDAFMAIQRTRPSADALH